ncbi:Crp/Fnr family transcriptional regulator [Palleronia caenipelagi]|nr:Crp/Fnr family transcriptional regulator [Palleronia caenipelagi]
MDAQQAAALINGPYGFAGALSVDTVAELLRRGRLVKYEKGGFVTRRGLNEPRLCIVLSGSVRLTAFTKDGREMLTHIVRPGNCWGVFPCLGGYRETNDSVIEEPSTILILRPEAVGNMMWSYQDFQKALVQLLCDRLNLALSLSEQMGAWVARERLAWRLLLLANALDERRAPPPQLEIVISQDTLAAMVHLSRQRTNMILKDMERDGVVVLKYGRIEILDIDALRNEISRTA